MEILDLYNAKGEKLNKTIIRGEQKPQEGEFIKLAIVYLKAGDKYLLQKTSEQKGSEYAATGGHVPAGVTSCEQVIIECQEELGIDLEADKLQPLGSMPRGKALFDVYMYEDDALEHRKFSLQQEEVEAAVWLTKEQINRLIEEGNVRPSTAMHYGAFIQNNKQKKEQ